MVRVAKSRSASLEALQRLLDRAGWQIEHLDLDLTGQLPKADIKLKRWDGRWILARSDSLGRAYIETFQRVISLGMSSSTKGRQPLSPQVHDTFTGRQRFHGARAMLRSMTTYLADNSRPDVALKEVRQGWAAVMSEPLRLGEVGARERYASGTVPEL